jgi:hypothetical protein
MMRDERHQDFADVEPDECEYVCQNPACEHSRKARYVKCRTELGLPIPIDDRELDCECGDRFIPVDMVGCESVSEDTVRRYRAVGA